MRAVVGLLLIVLGISYFIQIPLLNFLFALFIIVIGWRILTGQHSHRDGKWKYERKYRKHYSYGVSHDVDEVRVFGETKHKVEMSDFEEGRAIAVMGGIELDMTDVKDSGKTVDLELVAVLGGLRLDIPQNWRVENHVTSVAGGVDDNTSGKGDVTLRIRGAAVLGGIEIHN